MRRYTKTLKIKSVGIMSFGKVMGMSGALLGGIFGVLYGGIVMVASLLGFGGVDGGFGALGVVGGIALMIGVMSPYRSPKTKLMMP